jgi:hypothetical protein
VLERLGLALAGRAGARLAAGLGFRVSRHTMLRLVRGLPDPQAEQVTVLGVDLPRLWGYPDLRLGLWWFWLVGVGFATGPSVRGTDTAPSVRR